MRQVVNNPQELSVEERNLLSVAYKNSAGNKRTSWRILDTLEKKEEAKAHSQETQKHLEQIKKFKKQVEVELSEICNEIIETLDEKLLTQAKDSSSKVFYLKMKGDYYRYISEYSSAGKEEIAKSALEAYQSAQDTAN